MTTPPSLDAETPALWLLRTDLARMSPERSSMLADGDRPRHLVAGTKESLVMARIARARRPSRAPRKPKAQTTEIPQAVDEWSRSVVRVGDGRGFVVETEEGRRYIITAGHCLPNLPPSHPGSYSEERTWPDLVAPIGAEPTVEAECLFVDPVADLAVLCSPDGQERYQQAEAYEALMESAIPLPIGSLTFERKPLVLPDGSTVPGLPSAESDAWLQSLNGQWFSCRVQSLGHSLWIKDAAEPIRPGMSGSPVVAPDGKAIGVICISHRIGGASGDREGGPNPELAAHLPGWILRACQPED